MNRRNRNLILSAHTISIVVRKDGSEHWMEGDFLKELLRRERTRDGQYLEPPQAPSKPEVCSCNMSSRRHVHDPEHGIIDEPEAPSEAEELPLGHVYEGPGICAAKIHNRRGEDLYCNQPEIAHQPKP